MGVTLIGIASLILSIFALIRKDDNLLLKLVVIFSIFMASIAFDTFVVILPFEIPMLIWLFKQLIYFVKNIINKKDKEDKKEEIKNNKIIKALLFIIISIILSVAFLYISKINYEYIDNVYKDTRNINFSATNITQSARAIVYFIFAIVLSLKIKSKEQIKSLIRTFAYASFFAVVWGIFQYIIFYLGFKYPAFIFNNNPYAAQGYNQMMHGIKRISSIALEPSGFALNLSIFIPIIVITFLRKIKEIEKNKRILYYFCVIISVICMILTTSSTAIIILTTEFAIILLFYLIKYIRNKENLYYKECVLNIIKISLISILISIVLCFTGNFIYNNNNENYIKINGQMEIVDDKSNVNVDIKSQNKDFFEAIIEMTVGKLGSGSGLERLQREVDGFRIYSLSPVFGVGYLSYRTFTLFTNVLVNMGILGFLSFIYLFIVVIGKIRKNRNKSIETYIMFITIIIGMIISLMVSVPDLGYTYCWIILVCIYKYYDYEEEVKVENKKEIIVGIDARGLDGNKTGISVYIDKIIEKFNEEYNDKSIKFIMYSTRDINLSFTTNENVVIKKMEKYKKGVVFTRYILPRILKEDNVDVFWGTQHLLPRRNRYTKNIKYVLTVHDLAIHKLKTVGSRKNTIIHHLYFKRSCLDANKIISVSNSTKNDLIEMFKIDANKIEVIYPGTNFEGEYTISEKEEKEILSKFNIANKNYIFFVSTIEPRKNIVTLIKAFECLKEKNNKSDLKLILAGGLGWKYESVIETIDNSKFKSDINLAGYITNNEKICLFHNSKCFAYPSLYEGFGMPILEAMQKGTVVVTSNISSIPEVGGDAAMYIQNVNDYEELSKVLEKAINLNEEEREKIINKGYEQVKKFNWNKCANKVKNILKTI